MPELISLPTEIIIRIVSFLDGENLIDRKKITTSNYIYAKKNGSKWIKSKGDSTKMDKIFLKLDYVKSNEVLWNELIGKTKTPEDLMLLN